MNIHNEAMSELASAPCLFSTIRAGLVDPETGEVVEALYDEAGQYCEVISNSLDSFRTDEYPTNDLMRYLHWPDAPQMEAAIRSKVHSAHITVEARGDILYAKLELDMTEDLTEVEMDAFLEQVECQYRDGWGAQFELINIPVADHAVCLRLWHDDISFFVDMPKDHLRRQARREPALPKGDKSSRKKASKAKKRIER